MVRRLLRRGATATLVSVVISAFVLAAARPAGAQDLDPCITIAFSANATGTSTLHFVGNARNNCAVATHGGHIDIVASITDCPGLNLGGGSGVVNLPNPWAVGATMPFSGNGTGICERCMNGQAVGFPPFDVAIH